MATKWLNKRQQAVSERLNKDARRTEEDSDFVEMSAHTDATQKAIAKLVERLPCFLHPNPNARVKAAVGTAVSKLRKTAAEKRYPHAAGELSAAMLKTAEELPPDSAFGSGLRVVGDAMAGICEAMHLMDAEVYQNTMSPLKDVMENELKEIAKQRKKMDGRRLDFDFKQRKRESGKATVSDADIAVAKQKYEDSKISSENAMMSLLNNDTEQVGQLAAFVSAYLTCARAMVQQLETAEEALGEIMSEAESRPKREARPVSQYHYDDDDDYEGEAAGGDDVDGPAALAAYDFEAENEGELSFREGQTIKLLSRLDENWLEGELEGRCGIFPSNYVEVIRDL